MLRPIPNTSQINRCLITGVLFVVLLGTLPARAEQTPPCTNQSGQIMPVILPSTLYRKAFAARIYLPACYDAKNATPYPVIYLLHGGGADETQWPDLNVQLAADTLISQDAPPFVVVMPGAPYDGSVDYSMYVIRDLLPGIESRYRVQTVRPGRAIAGLSLGGYWALDIAFSHPNLFAAVGGYSPVVNLGSSFDPLRLARKATVQTLQGLRIALDVGDADSLDYDTNQLAQTLRARGITVSLTVGQGGHERDYWRARTFDYFSFILNAIGPSYETAPDPEGTWF